MKNKYKLFQIFIIIIAILLPFAVAMKGLWIGDRAFWYDPARDFLLGLDNLNKFTLIGPTSGIPGLFYGPYWIWLISLGLLFSKDPRIVIFIILTIPYFTIAPFILFKFGKIFGLFNSLLLWIIFIFSMGTYYATNPWNPHLAPLLFLILSYLIVFTDFYEKNYLKKIKILFVGLISGLILNTHISFGIGVFGGIILFFLANGFYNLREKNVKVKYNFLHFIQIVLLFATGVAITFLPFFVFEMRHEYVQIKTILKVFSAKGSVVNVIGISQGMIIANFFGKFSELVKFPVNVSYGVLFAVTVYLVYLVKKNKVHFQEPELRLIVFLLTATISILLLYLSSKNPVWGYHFIGVEIIFLLFTGLIISKIRILSIFLGIWILISIISNSAGIISPFYKNPLVSSSLTTKKYIVKVVNEDANKKPYVVFAYSPSIYIYEYTYLFKWLFNKDIPYDPSMTPKNVKVAYLILPDNAKEKINDFINYRTPENEYKTTKTWNIPDGTTILKRVRK